MIELLDYIHERERLLILRDAIAEEKERSVHRVVRTFMANAYYTMKTFRRGDPAMDDYEKFLDECGADNISKNFTELAVDIQGRFRNTGSWLRAKTRADAAWPPERNGTPDHMSALSPNLLLSCTVLRHNKDYIMHEVLDNNDRPYYQAQIRVKGFASRGSAD